MREIARRAGVSLATVSRVINDSGYASAETRARVERAVAELQFTPNARARAMRRGESRMVGVLLPSLNVHFFGILAHTIERALFQRGYQALICCTDEDPEQEARYIGTLLAQQVDGVLAASVLADAGQFRRIEAAGIPIVALDRDLPAVRSVTVKADHREGGRMMARHLRGLGHRAIGIIGAPDHSAPIRARLDGALEVLAADRLAPAFVRLGPEHSFDACRDLATAALTAGEGVTAIIGTTDIAAIGAIHAAIALGRAVPADLSVIGFDDLPAARYVLPALTTVAQPLREIGALAVVQLCKMMAGEAVLAVLPDSLPLRLIRRDTTGPGPFYSADTEIA